MVPRPGDGEFDEKVAVHRGADRLCSGFGKICHQVGYPQSIRVDQGSEFISRDLDLWAYQKGVVLDFSRPGKPTMPSSSASTASTGPR